MRRTWKRLKEMTTGGLRVCVFRSPIVNKLSFPYIHTRIGHRYISTLIRVLWLVCQSSDVTDLATKLGVTYWYIGVQFWCVYASSELSVEHYCGEDHTSTDKLSFQKVFAQARTRDGCPYYPVVSEIQFQTMLACHQALSSKCAGWAGNVVWTMTDARRPHCRLSSTITQGSRPAIVSILVVNL